MSNNTHDKFPGFPQTLEKASWQFPSIINGHVHSLSGAEFKVLWYILRHTYGWQKNADYLSQTQIQQGIKKRDGEYLDKGTGLTKPWIRKALKSLEERNFITIEKTVGKVSKISPKLTRELNNPGLESNPVPLLQSNPVLGNKITPQYILPISNTNNIPVLSNGIQKLKCPNSLGHQDCTNSIESIQIAFKRKFTNFPKQLNAYHKIIKAGFTPDQIGVCLNKMDEDKFWANNGWDLMDVSNTLSKGGSKYV